MHVDVCLWWPHTSVLTPPDHYTAGFKSTVLGDHFSKSIGLNIPASKARMRSRSSGMLKRHWNSGTLCFPPVIRRELRLWHETGVSQVLQSDGSDWLLLCFRCPNCGALRPPQLPQLRKGFCKPSVLNADRSKVSWRQRLVRGSTSGGPGVCIGCLFCLNIPIWCFLRGS